MIRVSPKMSTARRATSRVETAGGVGVGDAAELVDPVLTVDAREESVLARATGFPAAMTVFGWGAVAGCE
jgi:hypothetical protein